MYFFTDINTKISNYCLLNIKQYNSKRKKTKKLIFVDPSVIELKQSNEFSNLELLHYLASGHLESNEYISIDYPCDMNPTLTHEFIEKTYQNNIRYTENMKYICTVQYEWQKWESFLFNMNRTKYIWSIKDKILGIGNFCRILRPNTYTDKVIKYLIQNREDISWIHFFGLALSLIKKYIPMFKHYKIKISVDSTKWTRACTGSLKSRYGLNCSSQTRDIFFLEYMKTMPFKVYY